MNEVKVGLGTVIFKDGKILVGIRKGSHGAGEYCFPGGKMEYGETPIEGAKREVREETGLEITNVEFLCLHNLAAYMPKHYVDIGFIAEWKSGEPTVREPDKCERWDWVDPDKVPGPGFATMQNYLKALKNKSNNKHLYFEV